MSCSIKNQSLSPFTRAEILEYYMWKKGEAWNSTIWSFSGSSNHKEKWKCWQTDSNMKSFPAWFKRDVNTENHPLLITNWHRWVVWCSSKWRWNCPVSSHMCSWWFHQRWQQFFRFLFLMATIFLVPVSSVLSAQAQEKSQDQQKIKQGSPRFSMGIVHTP